MNWISKKTYLLFWFVIPYLLGVGLLFRNSAIDIQLHDTYLVLSILHIGIVQSIMCALFGLVYWRLRERRLMPWATVIHVLVTIIFAVKLMGNLGPSARRYANIPVSGYSTWDIFILLAAIWGLAQLLFLVNVVVGLVRERK